MADPPPITINIPKSSNIKITGANHHFLRATINLNISFKKSILLIWFYWLIMIKGNNTIMIEGDNTIMIEGDNAIMIECLNHYLNLI